MEGILVWCDTYMCNMTHWRYRLNTMQHNETHCTTPQHVTHEGITSIQCNTQWNILMSPQYNAAQCNTAPHYRWHMKVSPQYNAIQCNTLHHTTACDTWRYHLNTMQHTMKHTHVTSIQCNAMKHTTACVWCDAFTCDVTHSWKTRHAFMCDTTYSCVSWLIHIQRDPFMRDVTHPCRWRDVTHSCVTWRIHVRHDSSMCGVTHSCVIWPMEMRPVYIHKQSCGLFRFVAVCCGVL